MWSVHGIPSFLCGHVCGRNQSPEELFPANCAVIERILLSVSPVKKSPTSKSRGNHQKKRPKKDGWTNNMSPQPTIAAADAKHLGSLANRGTSRDQRQRSKAYNPLLAPAVGGRLRGNCCAAAQPAVTWGGWQSAQGTPTRSVQGGFGSKVSRSRSSRPRAVCAARRSLRANHCVRDIVQ